MTNIKIAVKNHILCVVSVRHNISPVELYLIILAYIYIYIYFSTLHNIIPGLHLNTGILCFQLLFQTGFTCWFWTGATEGRDEEKHHTEREMSFVCIRLYLKTLFFILTRKLTHTTFGEISPFLKVNSTCLHLCFFGGKKKRRSPF